MAEAGGLTTKLRSVLRRMRPTTRRPLAQQLATSTGGSRSRDPPSAAARLARPGPSAMAPPSSRAGLPDEEYEDAMTL